MPHPYEYDDDHGDDRPGDRPGDRYGDEGYDDHEVPADRQGRLIRRARERVNLPAIFMLVVGLLCLAFNVMAVVLLWAAPDVIIRGKYDMMKQVFPQQPLPAYEDYVKQEQTQQTVVYAIRLVATVFVALGAMKMRSLHGYGLAMTGTVLSIIPLCPNECCCTMPFGIWALIVLLNSDVKRAFQLVARAESLG